MNPPTIEEMDEKARNIMSCERYCLHPDAGTDVCKGGIIKAHTIQRSGGLSRIAKDNHVMGTQKITPSKILSNEGKLKPSRIGINEASTFTGFCGYHDGITFDPIEKGLFLSCPQHCFLLGYRAICRELFAKKFQFKAVEASKDYDRGYPLSKQVAVQVFLRLHQSSVQRGVNKMEGTKKKYDNALVLRDFSMIKYHVIRTKKVPDILCSGALFPEFDFDGKTLQIFGTSNPLDMLTLSIIPTDNGGAIVFSWMNINNTSCTDFINTLKMIPCEKMQQAIVRFVFSNLENCFWSPAWWESLSPQKQHSIIDMINILPTFNYSTSWLADDGIKYVEWEVDSIETNVN